MTRPDDRQDGPGGPGMDPYGPPERSPYGGDPWGRPPRPKAPVDHGGRRAVIAGVPGIVLSFVFFPVGAALDVVAIVTGARALRRVGGSGGRAPGAVAGIVLGVIGLLLAAFLCAVLVVFWDGVNTYQQCMSGANTIQAQNACKQALRHALEQRLGNG
ncbi:MAG: DUF4190 domain-containing protein [Streptosporangiaceae bacterium]